MKAHMNVPIFIPHLGCPHSCVFCNQHSVTHIQAAPSPESVALYIQKCLANKGNRTAEVAFFGGSFTGLPLSTQAAYLAAAAPFAARGEITGIRLSTRPDFISSNILDFLREHYVKHIELGAQSMCDAVLTACGRGRTAADTVRASALILEKGFVLRLQMMTGARGGYRPCFCPAWRYGGKNLPYRRISRYRVIYEHAKGSICTADRRGGCFCCSRSIVYFRKRRRTRFTHWLTGNRNAGRHHCRRCLSSGYRRIDSCAQVAHTDGTSCCRLQCFCRNHHLSGAFTLPNCGATSREHMLLGRKI